MKAKRLNLMPKSNFLKPTIKLDQALLATAMLLATVLTVHGVWSFFELRHLRVVLVEKQNLIPALIAQAQASSESQTVSKTKGTESISNKILSGQLPWADLFKELSLLIPHQAWLTSFNMKNNSGKPDVVLTGEAASQNIMADFFKNLEKSFYYNQMKMNYSERQADFMPAIYKFSFSTEAIKPKPSSARRTSGDKK